MERDLVSISEQLAALRQRARQLVAGLDDSSFNWRPQPDVWSIAQCVEHLNVSAQLFFRVIDPGLEKPVRGAGPFRYGFLERWFLRTMEPPVKFRARAPKHFQPPPDASRDASLATFLRAQDEMEDRVRLADGLDLARIKVSSPVVGWIRYSLGIALQVMVAHERRHLWQAEQVRANPAFPIRDESAWRTAEPQSR